MDSDHKCTACGAPALVFRVRGATPEFACPDHATYADGWVRLDTPTKKTVPGVPSSMPPPRDRQVS